ncbi:SPOR domain-containing protein [Shimia sagamensis]|uniref:Sporulation related domain-containing protein n=1 Tax=Shimia sagamensis TaxID=1566352 RepID=A0ABY1P4A2_9RHOB|nr:SPOR domain-containing protein [Shimia sagamensis]SMP25394.1 Sporulation related domain-containing protein [Shimia sagamensis]
MKLTSVIAIGVIVSSLGIGAVTAQSISSNQLPAEFPPRDFKGKQFVDSRGCVYIRAGVDGATTWVPRVTRERKVICGFKPTFSKAQTTTNAAPKLDKNVVQIQPAAPEAGAPAVAVAPKATTKAPTTTTSTRTAKTTTKTTTRTTTAPKQAKGAPLYTTPTAARPTTTTTKKTTTRTAAPTTAAAPQVIQPAPTTTTSTTSTVRRTTKQAPRAAGVVSPCREGVTTWKGSPIRCGPQALSPVTPGTGRSTAQPPKMRFDQNSSLRRPPVGTVVKVGEVAPDVRVVPRHVYEANKDTHVVATVPEGYRRAFDDGRLNERRAEMTLAGQAQMAQIWTTSVPGKLVGISEDGEVVARAEATSVAPATVSTKSEPATKSLRLAGTPYVQVGTYSDAASAKAAAKQVKRLGLPVRIGKFQRGGVTQRMVLAGPFAGADGANAALAKTQGAGFDGAFVRQ